MTVNTTTSRVSYAGNGSTTTFSVPFYFLAAADLVVIRTTSSGSQATLVLNTDYTVSGAGNPAGGTVTCTTAPASTTSLVIFRDPAATQLTDYQANDPFPAETHERALDKLTMIAQRVKDLVSRAFTLSDGDVSGVSTTLPRPEANKIIGWNATGSGLQNVDQLTLATIVASGSMYGDTFTGDGTNTSWTLSSNPGSINNLDVSIGGVTQLPGDDYTWTSGTTLTTTSAVPNGVKILVRYMQALPQATALADSVYFTQAGANATPRTAQAKMREYLTPEDFGAVGDNTANDTNAMAAAMTEAVSSGLRLRLRDGASYFLSTWSTFTNSGVLQIEGNATLRGPASTVTFLSPAANFDIQWVTFSTWASVVSRDAAQSGSFTDVVFSNNRCSGCTAVVFNIERPVDEYRIENNDIDSCTGGYAIRVGENTYANQDTWQKGWIRSNRIKSISASGSTSAVAVLVYGREVTIADNKIDGVTQSGTGEAWGIYTKTRYAQVYGNYVNNVVTASNADNVGINIKGAGRGVTSGPQGFAVIVWGNHVKNVGAAGVRGGGIRAQTDDVLIFGNQCEDAGLIAFNTDESAAYRNVTIQNNLARWVSLVASTVGVRLEGSGTGVVADNNTVFNASTGIFLLPGGTGGVMQDAQVTRNRLFGCTFNIVFDAAAGRTLDRPVIESNVVYGGTYGLLQNSVAGTITNMRVRWNDLVRAATPAAGAALVTSIAQGNIGWLSASTTWDPPSIADGASAATTLTVGAAALGDAVVASFSNSLGGLALCAQVSAANTVEARLINNSGGAVDLASGTLRVQVIKGIA